MRVWVNLRARVRARVCAAAAGWMWSGCNLVQVSVYGVVDVLGAGVCLRYSSATLIDDVTS